MNQKELDKFRVLLQERLSEVKDTYDTHRNSLTSPKERALVESGDWSQELENEEVEEQIVFNDQFYMEKIQKALKRIDDGSYGSCESCECDIPLKRLRAKPSVSLCITCQEQKDTGQ